MIQQLKFISRTRRFDEISAIVRSRPGAAAQLSCAARSSGLRSPDLNDLTSFFKCLARYFDVRVSSGERSNAARQNSIRAKSKAPARVSPCYRLPDNTYPNADRETRTKNKVSKTLKFI